MRLNILLLLGLGDVEKIKYHDVFDRITQCYCINVVGLAIGVCTDIFDKASLVIMEIF